MVAVTAVAKSFGTTVALRACSVDVVEGEVHALVGENGSGKSTLVKILSGVHLPDTGEVRIAGQTMRLRTPRAAQKVGVVTVFQEVLTVDSASVLENVWLGGDGLWRRALDKRERSRRAAQVLERLLETPPNLQTPVSALSLSERQACCIARGLVRDPRVLILDEATSALDVATRDGLFELSRELCAQGKSVIFISHRMDEIAALCDRVTVLRSGETVATLTREAATTDVLVHHMTGGASLTQGAPRRGDRAQRSGTPVVRTDELILREGRPPVDVSIAAGELVGLVGLEGHGQDQFLQALSGRGAASGRVIVFGDGGEREVRSPKDAMSAHIAYVARDRRDESLFPNLSILENFALPTLSRDSRGGIISWRSAAKRLRAFSGEVNVRMNGERQLITTLSGGNQQKVILARWLAADPKVLLLNDPTRGIDLNAKRDVYRLLAQLTDAGVAVVMLSTEVDEHVELMDRVLVFREGSVRHELSGARLERLELVAAMFDDRAKG